VANNLLGGSGLLGGSSLLGTSRRPSLEALLGQEQARLLRTQTGVDRLGREAEALGLQDTQGRGAVGFLTQSLDYLTRPQSAVLGFLTGLSGQTQADETQGAMQRAAAALAGRERYTGADLVGRAAPDASIAERGIRSALGFGIDVATDPLTYLTAGTGGVIRGAAKGAVTEAQIAREANKIFKAVPTPEVAITKPVEAATALEKASEGALKRAESIRTSDQPVVRLGAERTTASQAPTITDVLPTYEARRAAGSAEIGRVAPIAQPTAGNAGFVDRLAKAAGEGQAINGPRGMRDAIKKTIVDEGYDVANADQITRRIIEGTTGEIRGGFGVRLPFAGIDSAGRIVGTGEAVSRRVADLTPGAGYLTDELGLRAMAESARGVFNNYRSGNFYRGWSKLMNGRFGAEYADFIRKAHTGEGSMDYATFTKLIANDSKRTASLAMRDKAASSVLQTVNKMIQQSENPEAVTQAAERYYMMADNMALQPNASQIDTLGFEIASSIREHGDNMFTAVKEAAAAAGIEVGDISAIAKNYIPRPITVAEARWRAVRGKRTSQYGAQKARGIGYDTDQYGRLEAAPNDVLNQRFIDQGMRPAGHKVFETDPLKIAAQQYASYSEFMSKLELIADLKATGLLVERTSQQVRLLNLPQVVQRGEKFKNALTSVADRLSVALQNAIDTGNIAQIDRVNAALSKVAADKTTIDSILSNIQDVNPESLKIIGNLTNIMKSSLATGEEAGVALTKAQKARLFSARGLVVTRGTGGNVEELIAKGLQPVGLTEGVRIPRGLDNLYADETVKDAVEKYFRVESGGFRDSKWFNDVYQPFYTLFKTFATVGRPGGYHFRNLQGAWWNNYLGDVSAGDHKLSASVLNETQKAQNKAKDAIDLIRAGKPSGLTGEEARLAEDIVRLGRARGSDVVDFERAQLADYILLKKLEGIKVGDTTMADVLISARDNGIMRGNRNLEYLRNEARAEGRELADAIANPETANLFRGRSKEELTKLQTTMNKAANLSYINVSGAAADLSENYVRLAAFLSGARRYGLSDNGTAAAYLTKALQFDYADLSDFERNVLKNVIPFYTWTRRNVPLQFFSLLNQPGKFNKLDFAKEELQSQFGANGDEDPMADLVPEWMREKMGFVTQFNTAGGPIAIAGPGFEAPAFDLNRYLALGNPMDVVSRVKGEVVSASNPIAKAFVESMTDIDTFTGGKFPTEGVPSPFGEYPIPGTFVGADGKRMINAQGYNIAKDIIPPLGIIARLGSPTEADRRLTNWLSTFAGASTSTLTTSQATAELRTRQDRLITKVERTAGLLGVDRDWLSSMIESGATADEIRSYIASGYGKRPASEG